jgi:hypothetical protein
MPDTPDFQHLTDQILTYVWAAPVPVGARALVLDSLRLVWNASGVADKEAIEAALGGNSQQNNINRALRSVDR